MDLVWSMLRADEGIPTAGPPRTIRGQVTIEFLAEAERKSARNPAERHLAGPGMTSKSVESHSTPKGGWWVSPRPVIIVMGGSGGGADHQYTARYASHGYTALAIAYFGVPGPPLGLVNIRRPRSRQ
jgi:hypothetical protein